MFRFPVKTPKIVQRLFPKYLWKKAFLDKTIYLTFDDGPTPEVTQWTLNTLKQFKTLGFRCKTTTHMSQVASLPFMY